MSVHTLHFAQVLCIIIHNITFTNNFKHTLAISFVRKQSFSHVWKLTDFKTEWFPFRLYFENSFYGYKQPMLTKITSIRTYSQREIQMSQSVTPTFVSQLKGLCTSCYYCQFGNRITQSLRPHCLLVGLGTNEVPSKKVI